MTHPAVDYYFDLRLKRVCWPKSLKKIIKKKKKKDATYTTGDKDTFYTYLPHFHVLSG